MFRPTPIPEKLPGKYSCQKLKLPAVTQRNFDNDGDINTVSNYKKSNYVESLIQSIKDMEPTKTSSWPNKLVVSGDGRYYCKEIMERIVRVCIANEVRTVTIPLGGYITLPCMSKFIRSDMQAGGFYVTGGGREAGPNGYIGIMYLNKYGVRPSLYATQRINALSKQTKHIKTVTGGNLLKSLDRIYCFKINSTFVEFVDTHPSYLTHCWIDYPHHWYDVEAIAKHSRAKQFKLKNGKELVLRIDCRNTIVGLQMKRVLVDKLGFHPDSVMREELLENHPVSTVNSYHDVELVTDSCKRLKKLGYCTLGAVVDATGTQIALFCDGGRVIPHCDVPNLLISVSKATFKSKVDQINMLSSYGLAASVVVPEQIFAVLRTRDKDWGTLAAPFSNTWRWDTIDYKPQITIDDDYRMSFFHPAEADAISVLLAILHMITLHRKPIEYFLDKLYLENGRTYHCHYVFENLPKSESFEMVRRIQLESDKWSFSGPRAAKKMTSFIDPADKSVHKVVQMLDYVYLKKDQHYTDSLPINGRLKDRHPLCRDPCLARIDEHTTIFMIWYKSNSNGLHDIYVHVSKHEENADKFDELPEQYLLPTLKLGQAMCMWSEYLPEHMSHSRVFC